MARPKIALDARKVGHPEVGIGRYVLELARHFPSLAPEFEFLLVLDHRLDASEVPDGCRQVVLGRFPFEDGVWSKLYSPWWMNTLVPRYLKRAHVSLFHATNFVLPLIGCCRYVTTIHDLAFVKTPEAYDSFYRLYLKSLVRIAVRRASIVIADSEATRSDLTGILKVNPARISVIHLGVGEEYSVCDDQDYLHRVQRKLQLPGRFLLHVGVVQRRKNLEALLKAGQSALRDGLIDEIVLAGRDGFGAGAVRQKAKRLGIEGRVRFLGYVPQEFMPGLYNLAQVLVMPSWYEGFGIPVLEAMACGTPVIASNVSSLPEVAGNAAMLVSLDDAAELARALRKLLTDSHLWSEMRGKGLNRAREFNWTETAAKHLEVYRQVLNQV